MGEGSEQDVAQEGIMDEPKQYQHVCTDKNGTETWYEVEEKNGHKAYKRAVFKRRGDEAYHDRP